MYKKLTGITNPLIVQSATNDEHATNIKDLKTNGYIKQNFLVSAGIDDGVLPNNSSTMRYLIVTNTTGSDGLNVGDIVYDNGTSSGVSVKISSRKGFIISTDTTILGTSLNLQDGKSYVWNGDSLILLNKEDYEEIIVQGRLTLESGVPVSTTNQTAKSTIYFTPYKGRYVSFYNNQTYQWEKTTFSETSLDISDLAKNTTYDVFAHNLSLLETPAPVLDWRFSEGATTVDSSGYGNHPYTFYGTTWTSSGRFGGGYSFPSGYKFIIRPYSQPMYSIPSGTNERTMSIWFKLSSTGQNSKQICGYGASSFAAGNQYFAFLLFTSSIRLQISSTSYRTISFTQDASWHNLVAVLPTGKSTTNDILIYLDGVLKTATTTGSITINTPALSIALGTWQTSGGENMIGTMDSFKIYNKALSQIYIDDLYNQESLSDHTGLELTTESWNLPSGGSITSITDAIPRVANTTTPPTEGSLVTISGDTTETSNNATWRVGTVVAGTSFTLLNLDGTDSSDPSAAGSASTFTKIDEAQTRAYELSKQNNVLVKNSDASYLYLGTIKTTDVTGQIEDSDSKRYVWNYYNRVPRYLGYSSTTDVTLVENTNNVLGGYSFLLFFVKGIDEAMPIKILGCALVTPETTNTGFYLYINLNSHTSDTGRNKTGGTSLADITSYLNVSDILIQVLSGNYINLIFDTDTDGALVSEHSLKTIIEG